jgi:hypothetical protein
MGKYDPLKAFLTAQPAERVPMTFNEIEKLVGAPLPKSKQYPAWWSNNPSNNTMTHVWLEAGFTTEQVDTVGERLVFRRVRSSGEPTGQKGAASTGSRPNEPGLIARLQAALGGTVRFVEGFDPAEPTGEIWDAER